MIAQGLGSGHAVTNQGLGSGHAVTNQGLGSGCSMAAHGHSGREEWAGVFGEEGLSDEAFLVENFW